MISIIVAMDEKRGIGKDNKLLFRISEDMKRFRTLTIGHPVILGRKTYESIGRPLPNRTNIVVTHSASFARRGLAKLKDVIVTHSFEEAIKVARGVILNSFQDPNRPSNEMLKHVQHDKKKKEIFVIGGGQIYAQAVPLADKLYLTIVEGNYDADTFFPEYEDKGFHVVREEKRQENGYRFRFIDLER